MASFNTPILLVIFNRPDTTQIVFDQIKKIQPAALYVSADGPRENRPGDKALCEAARQIVNQVDWPCQVKTLFRDHNLGCRQAVSQGISWFFSEVESGIILEDDCLPDFTFFNFCDLLLKKFDKEEQIMHISGNNFLTKADVTNSYYFSNLAFIWGWATWRRAWQLYDVDMQDFSSFLQAGRINELHLKHFYRKKYLRYFKGIIDHSIDTWDYQWQYTIWKNHGVCVTPAANLVTNIGFNQHATHTSSKKNRLMNMPVHSIDLTTHPDRIIVDGSLDDISLGTIMGKNYWERFVRKINSYRS
jgi:hypothetical protein